MSVGAPADTIAALSAEHEVGLVVMGLANREDPEHRKPGSLAYRVLRHEHTALVVVPAPDKPPRADQTGDSVSSRRAVAETNSLSERPADRA